MEREILTHLRQNARTPIATISRKTNRPTSTIHNVIRRLEKDVIKKYVSLLKFQELGFAIMVHYLLEGDHKLRDFLNTNPNVNNAHVVLNNANFYAECVFRNFKEMNEFKQELTKSGKILDEIFITEEIARESFIPQ